MCGFSSWVVAYLHLFVALTYPWAFRVVMAGCNMRWRYIQLCCSFEHGGSALVGSHLLYNLVCRGCPLFSRDKGICLVYSS